MFRETALRWAPMVLSTKVIQEQYHFDYALPWEEALKPVLTTSKEAGLRRPCFLTSSLAARQQLQRIDPTKWPIGNQSIPAVLDRLHERGAARYISGGSGETSSQSAGVPFEAFRDIVSPRVERVPLADDYVNTLKIKASKLAGVIPYTPLTQADGEAIKLSPTDYVAALQKEFQKPPHFRQFHSQALIGILTKKSSGEVFLCGRQAGPMVSGKGLHRKGAPSGTDLVPQITLIPFMTVSEVTFEFGKLRSRLDMETVIDDLTPYHGVLFPEDAPSEIEGIPLEPIDSSQVKTGFSFLSAAAADSRLTAPLVTAGTPDPIRIPDAQKGGYGTRTFFSPEDHVSKS